MIREFKTEDLDEIMELWLQTNICAHEFIDSSYWRVKCERKSLSH